LPYNANKQSYVEKVSLGFVKTQHKKENMKVDETLVNEWVKLVNEFGMSLYKSEINALKLAGQEFEEQAGGFILGKAIWEGCFVGQEDADQRAFIWFKFSSEVEDSCEGRYRTGLCYFTGRGVKQDFAKAKRYFQWSFDQAEHPAAEAGLKMLEELGVK